MDKKRKILITLSEQLIKMVDDYRFENRFESRSEAIRLLLDWALKENPKLD